MGVNVTVLGASEPAIHAGSRWEQDLAGAVSQRTRDILHRRTATRPWMRRGWLVRRTLLAVDVLGLTLAFLLAQVLFSSRSNDIVSGTQESLLFAATLPLWIIVAKIYGLYDRDEERADHPTSDDVVDVFHMVTVGAWLVFIISWLGNIAEPNLGRLATFWALALVLLTTGRAAGRAMCRRSVLYLQNTVIVGAGEVGQLIARKLLQHPEYGINVVGFVDPNPREARADLGPLTMLGDSDDLPRLVELLDVERVVIAFSNESDEETLKLVRSLRDLDVQVDVVPRLFDLVSPSVAIHRIEGLPVIGLSPVRISRSSTAIKRGMDVLGAGLLLILTAPLFAYIAFRIKRDSKGPVFFRQTRLGGSMREFTALKFRTMKVDTDTAAHRDYVLTTMNSSACVGNNGLYKLNQDDAVTPFGRSLRKTSLDELPQLINVLRGDMSLVGPRPCIEYETAGFSPHHFERFLVPAGITGLWQVTARARSSFGEALDMDVSYVRGWSLGLDLRLLCRTPLQLLRQRAGTA